MPVSSIPNVITLTFRRLLAAVPALSRRYVADGQGKSNEELGPDRPWVSGCQMLDGRCQSVFEIPVAVGREPSGISWPPLAPDRYTFLRNALGRPEPQAGRKSNLR